MARVLVIDDDAAIVGLLHELLEGEGHEVRSEVNEAALTIAAAWQPEVIFLDLMMPGLDGFAIMRRLQAEARTRRLAVVVMSAGYYLQRHRQELAVAGRLPKPFDLIDVLTWVDRITGRSPQEAVGSSEAAEDGATLATNQPGAV